jgi:hypothetical protein
VRGYDRRTSTAYEANVIDLRVQVYDHGPNEWFAFEIRNTTSA